MFYVYVIQNVDRVDELYLGFSSNLQRRLREHNQGHNRSTRGRQWQLIYYEAYMTEQAARKREQSLKRDGRVKRFLIERLMRYQHL